MARNRAVAILTVITALFIYEVTAVVLKEKDAYVANLSVGEIEDKLQVRQCQS